MNTPIARILLLSLAAAGGFWLSRRLARPATNGVPIEVPTEGVRLVPVASGGGA